MSPLGGGYLLSHFRSTIGVVRLNFSVRNGKRWNPHAITTLMSSAFRYAQCIMHIGRDDLRSSTGNANWLFLPSIHCALNRGVSYYCLLPPETNKLQRKAFG